MTVIEITRPAKCKDCFFIKYKRLLKNNGELGKRKSYHCSNPESGRTVIAQNDLVCDKWVLE
jgi:hypothetical protein